MIGRSIKYFIFLFCLILLLVGSRSIFAQKTDSEKSIFLENVFQEDAAIISKVANYLMKLADSDVKKARANYLLSQSNFLYGDQNQGLEKLFLAEDQSEQSSDFFLKSLICFNISFKCKSFGILDKAKEYEDLAHKNTAGIADRREKRLATIADILNQTEFSPKSDKAEEELKLLEKAAELIVSKEKPEKFLLAKLYQRMGSACLRINDPKLADISYNRATEVMAESEMSANNTAAATLNGQAAILINDNQLSTVESILMKASACSYIRNETKSAIDLNFSRLYTLSRDEGKSSQYQQSYNKTVESSMALERAGRNAIFTLLQEDKETAEKTRSQWYIGGIIGGILLTLSAFIAYFFYNRKLDNEYRHFEKIMKTLKSRDEERNEEEVPEQTERITKAIVISSKTEELVLAKLNEFERSGRFTNSNISLQALAKYTKTNTKYLSEIIHTHKSKNFNTYINGLRIEHIMVLMKDEPAYLDYKISYLAEVCGYSSHSIFTIAFKSVTELTPKQFINFLRKEIEAVKI